MKSTNPYKINVPIISLLILVSIGAIGFYFSRPQTIASADASYQQVGLIPDSPVDVETQPLINTNTQSVTQNDIKVDVTSAKMISTGVEIGICYTAPDNGEWRPMPGHLFYGKDEVYPDEIEFLPDEKLADGKNMGLRCALIRYRVDDVNAVAASLHFSVIRFYAPGREMYSPCEELQQRLNTNPKAKAYGLQAKCSQAGDGGISVTLTGHDKSVAKDKASKVLDEIAKGEAIGLWEFTISTIEK